MPSLSEILPIGTKRNDAGLLVRECIPIPSSMFNARSLHRENVHLGGQVVSNCYLCRRKLDNCGQECMGGRLGYAYATWVHLVAL